MSSSTTTTTIETKSAPKHKNQTKNQSKPSPTKKKKRTKKSSVREHKIGIMPNQTADYINTLNDPWEYGPVRLGFGTLAPTNLYTGYFRVTMTLNADGSGALVLGPTIGNSNGALWQSNAGHATATWTEVSGFTDRSAIASSASEARVVSIGLRVLPQVPATSAPGIIACGQLTSGITGTTIGALTPDSLLSLPQMSVGYGALGGTATGRPVDPSSFTFLSSTIAGDFTVLQNFGCPAISMTSFPASTSVFVEGVINVETLVPSSFGSASALEQSGQSAETVADNYNSIESMWRKIHKYVDKAGIVDHVGDLAKSFGKSHINSLLNQYYHGPNDNDLLVVDG